jgi:hypothetical protein
MVTVRTKKMINPPLSTGERECIGTHSWVILLYITLRPLPTPSKADKALPNETTMLSECRELEPDNLEGAVEPFSSHLTCNSERKSDGSVRNTICSDICGRPGTSVRQKSCPLRTKRQTSCVTSITSSQTAKSALMLLMFHLRFPYRRARSEAGLPVFAQLCLSM